MAIQMRRGNKANLDKTKLVAGEIAVSLDTKEVSVSDGNGDTIDLATKDDLQNIIKLNGGVTIDENTLVISPEEETTEEQGTPVDIESISIDGGMTDNPIKDATARADISSVGGRVTTLEGKIGANNGIATLNGTGKVPESQLPSYVDDVIEGYLYNGAFYEDSAHTTLITGESSKIYVDLSTDKTYRWSGTVYVCTGSSLELGETQGTAYEGSKGKANADNIADIQRVIPANASTSNKLATMEDVGGADYNGVEALIKTTVGFATKNILNCDIESGEHTKNGLTVYVTRYVNGQIASISVNGTATAKTYIEVASSVPEIAANAYILNGCPSGGSSSSYGLMIEGSYGSEFTDYGSGVLIQRSVVNGKVYIVIANGYTADHLYFYPMIRDKNVADDTYEGYRENVKSLLDKKADASDVNTKVSESLLNDPMGWGCKNLLHIFDNVVSQTINGVTFTVNRNSDGEVTSIVADGTATATIDLILCPDTRIYNDRDLILSGCPSGGNSNFNLNVRVGTSSSAYVRNIIDMGNGVALTENVRPTGDQVARIIIHIARDVFVDNKTFYPMLRRAADIADATYEPYHPSVEQTLRDAEVIEGKNRLENKATSTGIFTVNADKTVTVNSNASSDVTLDINSEITISESMILSGCPSGGSGSKYQLVAEIGSTYLTDSGSGVELSSGTYRIYILVKSGYGNGLVFKPMLCTLDEWDKSHDFEPYYIPLKDSKFDRSEQNILGAKNWLNLSDGNLRSADTGAEYQLTNNGIRVFSTNAKTWNWVSFWLKNLPANTNFRFRFNTSITLGVGRVLIQDKSSTTTGIIARDFSTNGEHEIDFNTGNYQNLCINFYSSLNAPVAGDVTYSNALMTLATDPDSTYQPYAMTNRELTEMMKVIDGSSGVTSTGTLADNYLILKRIGQEVFCQLRVNGTFTAGATLAVLPEGFRPKKLITAIGNITSKGLVYVDIDYQGVITCGGQAVTNENFTLLHTSWLIS